MEIAHERRRFGYRRIHDLLCSEFLGVNHKQVYRLYREAKLAVRRRRRGKRPASERVPLQPTRTVNEVWSIDFLSDKVAHTCGGSWCQDLNKVRLHSAWAEHHQHVFTQQRNRPTFNPDVLLCDWNAGCGQVQFTFALCHKEKAAVLPMHHP